MDFVASMLKKKFPQHSDKINTALNIYNKVKASPDAKQELRKIGINNKVVKNAQLFFNENTSNPLLKGVMSCFKGLGVNEVNSILNDMTSKDSEPSLPKENFSNGQGDLSKFYDGLKKVK